MGDPVAQAFVGSKPTPRTSSERIMAKKDLKIKIPKE